MAVSGLGPLQWSWGSAQIKGTCGCSMCLGEKGRCWGLQCDLVVVGTAPPPIPGHLMAPASLGAPPTPINPTHRGHRRGAAHQGFIGRRGLHIPSAGSEVSLKVPLLSATPVWPPWLPAPCATLCLSRPCIPSIIPDPHPLPLTPLSPPAPWCPSPQTPPSPHPLPCQPQQLGAVSTHCTHPTHTPNTPLPCPSDSVGKEWDWGALERRDRGAKCRQGLPHGTQS